MSLLLDALKKAADEKSRHGDASTPAVRPPESPSDSGPGDEAAGLTLELEEEAGQDGGQAASETGAVTAGDSGQSLDWVVAKTRREYRRQRLRRIALVMLFSLLVLALGGLYFLDRMQRQNDLLASRHRSVMRSVAEKTRPDQLPETSPLINKLVSDARDEDKIAYARQTLANKQAQKQANKQATRTPANEPARQAAKAQARTQTRAQTRAGAGRQAAGKQHAARAGMAAGGLSIDHRQQADPLGERLARAYAAYSRGDYAAAKSAYQAVLNDEADNRDARLGLAAIAMRQGDVARARLYYLQLLKQNPLDADALAGLSLGMRNDPDGEGERQLRQRLEETPQSAALHYALGNHYAREKKWKAAQQSYFNAWVNEQDNALYCYNLAVSLDRLGKSRQAAGYYRRALALAKTGQPGFSIATVQKRLQQIEAKARR